MASNTYQSHLQAGRGRRNTRASTTLLLTAIVTWTLLSATVTSADARKMYRYRNVEGNVVVNYQVPTSYAGAGYEVLNDEGMVIQVVPRALTDEERLADDAEKKQEAAAVAEQERLRQWDETLMLRYSTVEDIEAARKRALGELKIRLSILRGNRRSLKQSVENYQSQAADMERRGMKVDVDRLRNIETLQSEIAATDRAIIERQKEIEILAGAYQKDIDRFEMLLEVVELRRSLRVERANRKNNP